MSAPLPHKLFLLGSLCALFLLVLSGCTARTGSLSRPESFHAKASQAERVALRETLRARESEVHSARLLSRTTITQVSSGEVTRNTIRSALVFQKPDRLRLELLPINAVYTLQLLVTRDGASTLLIPEEKLAIEGTSAHGGLLRAALKLPLSEMDLASYLLGRIPERFADLVLNERESDVYRNPSTGSYWVSLAQFKDQWVIEETSGLMEQAKLFNRFDGVENVTIEISPNHETTSGQAIPINVALSLPEEGLSLEFALVSHVVNQDIPESLFTVKIPPDYRRFRR